MFNDDRCLVCGTEINEFTDRTGYMRCPCAHDDRDVIEKLMPQFSTKERCDETITILREGGYDISAWHFGGHANQTWSPVIPIIAELAERLMRHEPLHGARHHDWDMVCNKCIPTLSHCTSCDHDHPPACPVCKAVLVPVK